MRSIQLVLLWLLFSTSAWAFNFSELQQEDEFLPVEQAFQFDFNQQGNQLSLTWQIADGYYLYKDKTRAKADKQEITISFVQQGKEKHDEYFGLVTVFRDQLEAKLDLSGVQTDTLLVTYQGCADAGLCYPPVLKEIPLLAIASVSDGGEPAQDSVQTIQTPSKNSANASSGLLGYFDQSSVWLTLLSFFVLGLGLSLTPCVLPMVPILSSIISSQKSTHVKSSLVLSLFYVLGMATFYTLSGVLVGFFGAQFNVQLYLQAPGLAISFAVIFVLLALSMFGLYELQLPASWQSKLQQTGQNKKGLIATYIAGGVSALALSPCVSAPLASALVYISTTGDAVLGGSALLVMSLGMGLPLLLVGAGLGGWLPQTGGWMIRVKQLFGVIMLGMAIWVVERLLPSIVSAALYSLLLVWAAVHLGLLQTDKTAKAKNTQFFAWVLLLAGVFYFYHNYQQTYAVSSGAAPAQHASVFKRVQSVAELEALLVNSDGKKSIVDLYADWCVSCLVIEDEVFAKLNPADYPDYQFLQLDLTEMTQAKQSFLSQHNLFGPPALLAFAAGESQTAEFVYQAEFNLQQFEGWFK
ncbi:cytochrome c biogenesis protein transmembrane subunit [Catenovulum agarivorans DS-2]|uniref:Cytochrome c biogenesis protein transmembrane subunit n=1 Tax=Catenovulum agarivorans DS-2 TaxID=1328313 RepID=W7QG67_9ALTE|nr:protein-disulfide reductase DsbD [Catenovulum agarivorans]EWH10911.1 cytochrome c biogenesis protein transmembrane subunit [Catenovulum agarivorans DS-2]